jgi:hypothetical protein
MRKDTAECSCASLLSTKTASGSVVSGSTELSTAVAVDGEVSDVVCTSACCICQHTACKLFACPVVLRLCLLCATLASAYYAVHWGARVAAIARDALVDWSTGGTRA